MHRSRHLLPVLSVLLALLISGCERTPAKGSNGPAREPAPAATPTEDERLAAFFEEVFERDLRQSPETQAYLGRRTEDYGKWDDYTDEHARFLNEQAAADLERLRTGFALDRLGPVAQVSYRLFEYDQQRALENFPWRHHRYAVSQMDDVLSDLPAFLQNVHIVETAEHAEAYIERLRGTEQVMQQIIQRLRASEAIGVVPPMMVYPRVLSGAFRMLEGAPFEEAVEDGVLLADFRAKVATLKVDPEVKALLVNDAENALTGPFRGGYQALIAELTRLQGLAEGNHGAWHLPDGEAYYTNRVAHWTTIQRSVDDIHQLGLEEVARIRAEMERIMVTVGFEGDLQAFYEHVRNDPGNYYPNTDAGRAEYLAEATALVDGVYRIADQYFNVLPQAPLEVRRVEPWREDGSSTAFYDRPAPDGSRPGIYYVNLKNMNAVQKHIMNSLAYHEGVPGHHFQLAIQQELEGLPEFRKYAGYAAYTEGWALYSERVAWEAGLYEGLPMRDFGRLAEEMKRAVRLVVDTGMHAKRWSREACIEYMTANTPMAPADIERQIERYFVWPGQALAYKIGMLRILELREQAMIALGQDFDIRAFHDTVLKNGAVPLSILGQLVDDHIEARAQAD